MNHEYQAVLRVPFGALGLRVERDQLSGIDFLPATAETVAPQGELGRLASASLQQYLANPRHNFRFCSRARLSSSGYGRPSLRYRPGLR